MTTQSNPREMLERLQDYSAALKVDGMTALAGHIDRAIATIKHLNSKLERKDAALLNDIAVMMSEFVDNWPQPRRIDTALALIAKTMRAALNPAKHKYWMPGEADCPRDIKASNGEIHTLRCKVCGQDDPRDDRCGIGVMETCDACDGAGGDGQHTVCGKCDGAGGYPASGMRPRRTSSGDQ